MFFNISNHPTSQWGKKQLEEAQKFGEVVDVPFPNVDPHINDVEMENLAKTFCQSNPEIINASAEDVFHVMGETGFIFALVVLLGRQRCVHSTTQRKSLEKDGVKTSIFEFVQFRRF